jgi:hypothetical protein
MANTTVCKQLVLTKKMSEELAERVGKLLADELKKSGVKPKINKAVARCDKDTDLADKPEEVAERPEWLVKVEASPEAIGKHFQTQG